MSGAMILYYIIPKYRQTVGFGLLLPMYYGSEFTARIVREWLNAVGVRTLFITPGSPGENGYNESFNGKLRDEVLNVEIFDTLLEAKVLMDRWRREYNHIRPHSSLGYRPPAPESNRPKSMMNYQIKQLSINS